MEQERPWRRWRNQEWDLLMKEELSEREGMLMVEGNEVWSVERDGLSI